MNKFKNIRQLQAEKMRIDQQIDALDMKMHDHWNELKESLTPAGIVKDAHSTIIKNNAGKNSNCGNILKCTFTYGMALLLGKFAEKAVGKFSRVYKK